MYRLQLLNLDGSLHPPVRNNRIVSIVGETGVWEFPTGLQGSSYEQKTRIQVLESASGTVVNSLGLSAPKFTISGTMGSKPKTINGRTLEGREVTNDLIAFFQYLMEQRKAALTNTNLELIEMSFHDLINKSHWIVLPLSIPKKQERDTEPLRDRFDITLQGVREYDQPRISVQDIIAQQVAPNDSISIGALI